MGSPYINIAYDHNKDHIMGERETTYIKIQTLAPRGNYSHMDMVRERESC